MTMLEEIRAKWCDILVNLLECPVCYEIPQNHVYQCMSGHHICEECRYNLTKCPICEDHFGRSRNYLAEALSNTLQDIMTSLMYPTHRINKHVFKNKICVHTQTQETSKYSRGIQTGNIFFNENKLIQTEIVSIGKNPNVHTKNKGTMTRGNKRQKFPYFKVPKGNYPCRIRFCTILLPYGKMIEHLKSCHADVFHVLQENNGIFEKKSELKYIIPENHDLAFFIKNMGLFFVNITILLTGDLIAAVYIVNNASASKQFTFVLTIGSGENATMYSGMVESCRTSRKEAVKNCLYKKIVVMNQTLVNNGKFKCSLTIKHSNP